MAVYIIAQLKFKDRDAYNRYQAKFFGVFKRFKGQVLAADEKPLRLEGEYRREADGRLVRQVHAPYAETTTLEDGQATVERAGRAPRRIALARAPELAAVRNGFGALLAGDAERLQQHYTLHAEGGRQRWTLALVPRDPRLAASLARIVLHGRGAELRCVESRPVKGEPQRTLLAGAAAEAAGVTDATALAALCRGDAAR